MLGAIGNEKKEWSREDATKRNEYYVLLEELLPNASDDEDPSSQASTSKLTADSRYDALLNQIHLDLVRSRFSNSFSFFQQKVPASASCPIAPLPEGFTEASTSPRDSSRSQSPRIAVSRSPKRHALRRRLRQLEAQDRMRQAARNNLGKGLPRIDTANHSETPPPPIVLSPPSPSSALPGGNSADLQDSHPNPNAPQATSMSRGASSTGSEEFHSAGEDAEGSAAETQGQPTQKTGDPAQRPSIPATALPEHDDDRRSNCLLRILFLYSLLNPSVGYVQGMVEVASVALWVTGSATGLPHESQESADASSVEASGQSSTAEPDTNPHFEADAFWIFSLLLGELRELWDFEGLDHSRAGLRVENGRASTLSHSTTSGRRRMEVGGMARALRRLGARLRWADEELWRQLYQYGLSPSTPYYSFRWLATLLSTSLPLPSVVKVWDAILSEGSTGHDDSAATASGKVEFLLDILTGLLLSHKASLLTLIARAERRAKAEAEMIVASAEDGAIDDQDGQEIQRLTAALTAEESFASCMAFLQDLPDDDIAPVLDTAQMLKQKRIAADLTGEQAPLNDEEDVAIGPGTSFQQSFSQNIAAGKQALSKLKSWNAARSDTVAAQTGTPEQAKGGWLRSVSASIQRSNGPTPATPGTPGTPSRSQRTASSADSPASSSFLARIQASDAAAEFSKVSTNWTARAMDKWNQSGSSSSVGRRSVSESVYSSIDEDSNGPPSSMSALSSRLGSFSSVGAAFLKNKGRTFSTSSNASSTRMDDGRAASASAQHPAVVAWSHATRDQVPHFPLPDVMDSPDGRTEYAYVRPASMVFGGNLGAADSPSRMAGMRHSPGVSPLSANGNGSGSATSSPVLDRSLRRGPPSASHANVPDEWRFPSPNSAPMRTGPSGSSASSSSSARGAGPKPLLLAGSARAAREPSEDGSTTSTHTAPPSKVVRTGPLAGTGSPYTSRNASSSTPRRRDQGRGSIAGSQSSDGAGLDSSSSERYAHSQGGWLTPSSSPARTFAALHDSASSSINGGDELDHDQLAVAMAGDMAAQARQTPGRQRQPSIRGDETPQAHTEPLASGGAASEVVGETDGTGGRKDVAAPLASSTSLQTALQTAGAVPNLPSLRAASAVQQLPSSSSFGSRATSSSLANGAPAASRGAGKISAGAFGSKTTAAEDTQPSEDDPTSVRDAPTLQRPGFGSVSSSSDIPLVTNEGRQVRRRALPSGNKGGSNASATGGVSKYAHRRKSSGASANTVLTATPELDSSSGTFADPTQRPAQRRSASSSLSTMRLMVADDLPEDPVAESVEEDYLRNGDDGTQPRRYTLVDEPSSDSWRVGVEDRTSDEPHSSGTDAIDPPLQTLSSPPLPSLPSSPDPSSTMTPPILSPFSATHGRTTTPGKTSATTRASFSSAHSAVSSSDANSAGSSSRSARRGQSSSSNNNNTGEGRGIVRSKRSFKTGSTYGATAATAARGRSSSRGSVGGQSGSSRLEKLDIATTYPSKVSHVASPTAFSPHDDSYYTSYLASSSPPPPPPPAVPGGVKLSDGLRTAANGHMQSVVVGDNSLYGGVDLVEEGDDNNNNNEDDSAMAAIGSAFEQFSANASRSNSGDVLVGNLPSHSYYDVDEDTGILDVDEDDDFGQRRRSAAVTGAVVRDKAGGIKF